MYLDVKPEGGWGGWATHNNLTVMYIPRVEENEKMSKSPPYARPPPSSGLTLIGALLKVNYKMC